MKVELYDDDARLRYAVQGVEKSSLSEKNVEILKRMKLELLSSGNQGPKRVATILSQFSSMDDHINFYLPEASKEELMQLARKINQDSVSPGKHSAWTLTEYKKALKAFYRWHTGEWHPDRLDFMRVHPKEAEKPKIDNTELLTTRMIEQFINSASNPRDKALFGLLWDSGARISELLSLEWQDLVYKDDLMRVRFRNGKNGPRKIFVAESIPLLRHWRTWKQRHTSIQPDMPVFTNYRPYSSSSRMSYRNARKQISDVRSRIDIPSRIKSNPHAWRKARATDMASRGMTQPNMNAWFGWVPGSSASAYYIRLAARDLEKQVREIYPGLDPLEEEGPKYLGENIPLYDQSDLRRYAGVEV